jgi:hypothetical protein
VSFGVELYDHQTDPNETINKAYHSHSQQLLGRLSNQLHTLQSGLYIGLRMNFTHSVYL